MRDDIVCGCCARRPHLSPNFMGAAPPSRDRKLGKKRIIAETGAGQHGVATAAACALLNLECIVYMGAVDW